jgi:hypothetical protein
MERTKPRVSESPQKSTGKRRRLINENLIIPQKVVDKILMRGNPDALTLYLFYIKTGNSQHTISPRANESFCMNGTSLGRTRFRSAKKVLEDLHLIRNSQKRKSKTSFGECFIRLLSYRYSGDMRTVNKDLSLINKEVEDDFWENLSCPKCGTPLFISARSIPGRSKSTHKYKEISPESSISLGKEEIYKCPNELEYGKSFHECNYGCDLSRACKSYYINHFKPTKPDNSVADTCPDNHKFGVDTEKFPECDSCDVWNECLDRKEGK